MDITPEINEKIQELQVNEKNIQNFIIEKQNLQIELNGVNNALSELKNSSDDVYKILEGIMIKSDKVSLVKDLSERKKILELRLNSIEKQEKLLDDKISSLRKEINAKITLKEK